MRYYEDIEVREVDRAVNDHREALQKATAAAHRALSRATAIFQNTEDPALKERAKVIHDEMRDYIREQKA